MHTHTPLHPSGPIYQPSPTACSCTTHAFPQLSQLASTMASSASVTAFRRSCVSEEIRKKNEARVMIRSACQSKTVAPTYRADAVGAAGGAPHGPLVLHGRDLRRHVVEPL